MNEIYSLEGHTNAITSLAVLSNGNLASGSYDNTIKIWNVSNGTFDKKLTDHKNGLMWITTLVLLSNGDLVSGSLNGGIKIWDTNEGTLKRKFETSIVIRSLALLPNGNLWIGTTNGYIKIWGIN